MSEWVSWHLEGGLHQLIDQLIGQSSVYNYSIAGTTVESRWRSKIRLVD
jgi:hypothetical protein